MTHAYLLAQAATATVSQSPFPMPSMMGVVGVFTAITTLVLAVCGAVVYAYKLGGLKRDGEATRTDAVRTSEALAGEVRTGFKTLHRRMDRFDTFMQSAQDADVEDARWRSGIDGRLERVEGDVEGIRKTIDEDRRIGPSDRRHE